VAFLTIAGSIPVGSGPARLAISVGNPTAWFAATLRHALIAGGIAVTGEAYDVDDVEALPQTERRSMLLLSHRSPTLAEIAQPTLKESINLYGEAILRLNAAQGGLPTNDAALEGLQTRLGDWGISPEAWHIVDGSGLSRRNAVAPEALVAVLRRMYEPSGTSPWMTALPIAGRDGSLAGRMKGTPAENNVRAKTGTMTDVRTLAGYLRTRDGETLAFAILLNNFEGSSAEATAAVDRIVVHLAGFSRGAK
jgi:D-alanyl-D-alanine carboxypeptidase/D-alanyl-D-alanine-endopeptidase (penicillin-binding protein 4)